jgi:PKD repeat protein
MELRVMKRSAIMVMAFVILAGLFGAASAGEIDPGLQDILKSTPAGEPVSVLVFLQDRVDIEAMNDALEVQRATIDERRLTVVRSLLDKARDTQGPILQQLEELKTAARIDDFRAFWVANVIEVRATAGEIELLAARADVSRVYYNYGIEPIEPVDVTAGDPGPVRAAENGVVAVRAPEVWAMGYTGAGVLVANIDTGVEGDHPALASRWAGVADPRYSGHPEWAWYDPYLGINDFPYDNNGHGTHTMGTICGGSPGDEVGVAPGAYWIAAGAIDRGGGIERTVADAILSFQWMLNPDGDPGTTWDIPHVCSNSWGVTTGHGYAPCDETFWSYLDACEAAGTVILFAAGNEGTSGLRRPADRATDDYRTCAVAAVDGNTSGWPIAYFSSRGPTYCTPTGDPAIKPDIAAPGVSVRSAYPGGGYTYMSGTSMACPHVAGVVALIREANPNLGVNEVKQIMYETAYDLGSAGEDNSYGWGMVDAYEAVLLAIGDTTIPSAAFSGTPTSGCAPLTVVFTDESTGEITSWDWDFGDGGTSTEQNPTYVYTSAGTYTVSLTVTGPGGSDTETKANYITVYDVPVADFSGSPTSGYVPLTVNFTDLSTGNPTSWSWDFGDTGSSNDQNPTHTYYTPGLYTVSLTVTNACGSDEHTKVDYIDAKEQVVYECHVYDITVSREFGGKKWRGVADVTIVDAGDQPVANATVYGFFNDPGQKTRQATTGADGVATLYSKESPRPPSDYCFEVTDVTHSTYTYDPSANVVTRACESGPSAPLRKDIVTLPQEYELLQNRPNPFNPSTDISFRLPEGGHAVVDIFDISGRTVKTLGDRYFDAGTHTVTWDGKNSAGELVASGVYLYRLTASDFTQTKKMILMK